MDWDTNGANCVLRPPGCRHGRGARCLGARFWDIPARLRGHAVSGSPGGGREALTDYRTGRDVPEIAVGAEQLGLAARDARRIDKPADASEAVDSALVAISIERSANNLDTPGLRAR